MTPAVTVVIPAFDSAPWIGRALDSVFAQTRLPDEVVVADDASADATPDLVAERARHAPAPLRLVRLPANSGGPAAPINAGIRAAAGDTIAILEHDDAMLPARLARQLACLAREPRLGLVISRCLYNNPKEGPPEPTPPLDARLTLMELGAPGLFAIPAPCAYRALVGGMFALTWSCMLFPKRTWEEVGGADESIVTASDYAFLQKVSAESDLGFVDEPLTDWHIRGDSLYRATRALRRSQDILAILRRFDPARLDAATQRERRRRLAAEHRGATRAARAVGRPLLAARHAAAAILARWAP